ncbi:hypothetical protein L5515_017214 [Caenorhabditis briggsae]|uniref:SCP domain-containing protein n=1 Tax=Caenorhabditis briggsae TaxID=6238 RepID=A0AAE9FE47_CAEBR|nr:hypothetical protein L5515_017214 [Caenorhabditis briggsae]
MPVRISGVDPELTKIGQFDAVMNYLDVKAQEVKVDPAQYDVESLKKFLVHFHNKYRAYHQAKPLSTDSTLNSAAQKWANEMAHRRKCLIHEDPSIYGENLSYFAAVYFPDPKTCAAGIIQSFYTEGTGYDYSGLFLQLQLKLLDSKRPFHATSVEIEYQNWCGRHYRQTRKSSSYLRVLEV